MVSAGKVKIGIIGAGFVGSVQAAAKFADLVIVAIPFGNYTALPVAELEGKTVLDANNYYPARDGNFAQLDNFTSTTSELLQAHLPRAKVVKAFNAILERHIGRDARPSGHAERRALPICGDDSEAKRAVAELQEALGFDTVDAGTLAQGWRFERDRPAYCVKLNSENLSRVLAETGSNAAEGLWF